MSIVERNEQAQAAYEMLWDCKFCGKKKLLGLTHRHCPECGAPQNAEERYFPSDAERVLAKDHEYAGADFTCTHCGQATGRSARHCGGCGAPFDGARDVTRRHDQIHGDGEAFAGQSTADARRERSGDGGREVPTGRSRMGSIARVGLAIVLVLAAAFLVALFWKKSDAFVVNGHTWKRELSIERFGPVADSSWCDRVPADARGVRRSREVRSHRQVADGEDCHTRKIDRGNGTFVEKEECAPKYRDEPVYDDKCFYDVSRWRQARTAEAHGASTAETPRWPAVDLARTGSCEGCEREGARKETYTVLFSEAKGGTQQCEFDANRWASFGDGTKWTAEVRALTGSIDCASLRPR